MKREPMTPEEMYWAMRAEIEQPRMVLAAIVAAVSAAIGGKARPAR